MASLLLGQIVLRGLRLCVSDSVGKPRFLSASLILNAHQELSLQIVEEELEKGNVNRAATRFQLIVSWFAHAVTSITVFVISYRRFCRLHKAS